MYKGHSIWDDEQEKKYAAAKQVKQIDYSKSDEYKAGQSDYVRGEKAEDNKEASEFEKQIEENLPKKQEAKEEHAEIVKKVADELRQGPEIKHAAPKQTAHKSIEEAINKAIKQEKEVIRL